MSVDSNTVHREKSSFSSKHEEDQYFYNMVDPVTGKRFDIPMLNTQDPNYYFKYIKFMKIKEISPNTFDTLLRWN